MVMGKSGRKVATILYSKEFYDLETDYEFVSGLRLWINKSCPESRGSFCYGLIDSDLISLNSFMTLTLHISVYYDFLPKHT